MILTIDTDKKLIIVREPVGMCELYEQSKSWKGYRVVSSEPKNDVTVNHHHYYPDESPKFGFVHKN